MRGINWKGKYFLIPQAASVVDASALNQVALGASGRLVIMGEMIGLVAPKTVKKIGSPSEGLALIHPDAEEARAAIRKAFDPAKGLTGASDVYLVPVNPALQASLILDAKVKLTAYIYGLPSNTIRAKVEAGSIVGKKVTVDFQGEPEVFDNIAKKSLTIQYTGAGTASVVDITAASLAITTTGGAAGETLTLDFATYKTLQQIADALDAIGTFDVTIESSSPIDLGADLDFVVASAIKAAPVTFNSDLAAMVATINQSSGYVSAEKQAGVGTVPVNSDWTFLAGGVNGVTVNQDWQDAFDVLKGTYIDFIAPLTSDASLHTMLSAHLKYMSGFEGKSERRGFVGGPLLAWNSEAARTANVAALKLAAKNLNDDRIVHAALGCKDYDENGDVKLYPAYITAVAYAGIAAGNEVQMPLTRKYLNIIGLEAELRVSEIKDLIASGLAVPVPDKVRGAGFYISRQITTWLMNDNDYRIEFSVGRGADYIAAEVRKRHDEMVGNAGDLGTDQTMLNITNAVLAVALREGIIDSFDPKKTQIRVDGTVRYVDYSAAPVLPINFIFGTYHLEPTVRTIQL
jgi:hypothetical protein